MILLVLTWGACAMRWSSPLIVAMIGRRRHAARRLHLACGADGRAVHSAPSARRQRRSLCHSAGGLTVGCLLGLTVYLPMFYEVVYSSPPARRDLRCCRWLRCPCPDRGSQAGVMLRRHRYLWISIAGGSLAAVGFGALAFADRMPLWLFLVVLSVGSLGVGPMFSTTMATMQNAVARNQIGTATGAMNYARALMSSFAVAGFTAILMAALGAGARGTRQHRSRARAVRRGSRHRRSAISSRPPG